jgi:mannose-6-phosphate isomerase-like protein (cupin superfamily)
MPTATSNDSSQAYVIPADEGQLIENLGLRLLAPDVSTNGSLLAAVVTNPGPGGPPVHTHATIDELYFVLRGRYRFRVGDQEHEGGAGTFAYIPRGTSHSFASVGHEEGQLFTITLPSTEQFLRGISALQDRGVDQQEMADHFRSFNTAIDGAPLV